MMCWRTSTVRECLGRAAGQISTSEIQHTYDKLWSQAVESIRANSVRVDPNLNHKHRDLRRGLTLICRPSSDIQDRVMGFLGAVRELEPSQYYYEPAELHTTVLALITCSIEFSQKHDDIDAYTRVITEAMEEIPAFEIHYQGITASPDCMMIQGYPKGSALHQLRWNLRERFGKSGLKTTLDQRFMTHTAHLTCLRFQNPVLHDPKRLLDLLCRNKDMGFGTSRVHELALVVNDWYMSDENVQVVGRFPLKQST